MASGITKEKQTGLECGKCMTKHNQSDNGKEKFLEDSKKKAGIVRAMVMSNKKQTI